MNIRRVFSFTVQENRFEWDLWLFGFLIYAKKIGSAKFYFLERNKVSPCIDVFGWRVFFRGKI